MKEKLQIILLYLMLGIIVVLLTVISVISYRNETSLEKISTQKERIKSQGELIKKMIPDVDAYHNLVIEHEELIRNTEIIASLSPLKDIVSIDEINELIKHVPYGNPFRGRFKVTAEFGISKGMFNILRFNHQGTDLIPEDPENMEWTITPLAAGRVVSYGYDEIHGKNIIIEHNETTRTRYSHLEKIYYSGTTGKYVRSNTAIGEMGETGLSNGKHLHWELLIFNGNYWIPVNGESFLVNE